ncbi:hypothetical protein AUG86_01105 [Euryarchaeota archaeon 13_1_20CM_4_64_14]|nr:MAG: hypothetical protein AUG86_01105 [Euryarchaeota archaeon 13_1_20CM_4_64_14]
MHVIFVAITPFPKIGGGWTFLTQMSSGMGGRRHTTAVVSPKQMPSAWMTVINRTAQIVRVAFRSWLWFFVRMALVGFAIRRYVSQKRLYEEVDIFDAQDPVAFLAVHRPAQRRNRPTILTIHGYFHHESNMGSIPPNSFWGLLLRRVERLAYSAAPEIVVVDTRLKEYLLRLGTDPKKVHVRRNSVDCAVFAPSDPASKAFERSHFRLHADDHVILCARRLEEKCGVRYAIEAMSLLTKRLPNVVLLIAGSGSLESSLRLLVSSLGIEERVRFLGDIDHGDMPSLLRASDAAVVPSITVGEEVEATSFAALEAMASAVPVVASDIGGLREIMTDDLDGILVPERDSVALASALLRVLGPEGQRLGNAARRTVEASFSLQRGVDETVAFYRLLIDGMPLTRRAGQRLPL